MPAFRYSAISAAGELVRGTTDAADEAAVLLQLRRQGHVPARVEPAGGRSSVRDLLSMEFGRRGLGRQEVTNLTRELAIMLEAGQDMDRALRFLVETAPSARVGRVVDEIRQAIRDGSSLAAALTRHSQSFSRLYIGLVRAGEAGGTLAATLERLANLLERERGLAATVQSAMIYPTILVVAAIGSITLLLTEVLPQFVPLFEENGVSLPRPT
ncbi:MAG TPA: type II secretion system F family protein, partial [Rhodopila sp.]|nr:type II secretion system F family protein [Rhodopila sp.]